MDPAKIEFEDSIMGIVQILIKGSKAVSQHLWHVFPHLRKIFDKNKR
jgi:hypothetical protein